MIGALAKCAMSRFRRASTASAGGVIRQTARILLALQEWRGSILR